MALSFGGSVSGDGQRLPDSDDRTAEHRHAASPRWLQERLRLSADLAFVNL